MANGLSASIDMDDSVHNSTTSVPKESASGLIIPFKIPVKAQATPIITTPTPPPAPQRDAHDRSAVSNTQQAADLAAKLVKENPENALKILEQQEQ